MPGEDKSVAWEGSRIGPFIETKDIWSLLQVSIYLKDLQTVVP